MAKTIKTRIQLKYDTLTNWQSSAFNGSDSAKYLKAGEIAIVTLAPNKEVEPEAKAGQHPLLFKVGTGNHKFDDLPWASGLAADVYTWAKAADVKYEGQHIKFVGADGGVIKDLNLEEFVTAQDMLNDYLGDNLTALTTTAEKIVPAINELDGEIGNLSDLSTTNKGDLVTAINEVRQAVEVGGTGSVVSVDMDDTDSACITYTVYQGDSVVSGDGAMIEVPKVATGSENGTISYGTTSVAVKGLASAAYVTVDSLNATAKGYADAVEAKLPTSADYGVLTVIGKDAIKVTEGQNPEVSLDLDASGNVVLSQSETGLKATIDLSAYRLIADDEDTTYGLAYDSENKVIKLVAGGTDSEISASDFIADGMLQSVVADKENNTLTFTWNTDGGATVTTVNLTDIADIYTGKNGTTINVAVSNTNEISAEVNAKSITSTHLADDLITAINKDDNTTYTVAATTNKFEFTVTPSEGDVQTVTLKAGALAAKDKIEEGDIDGTISVTKIEEFEMHVADIKVNAATNADTATNATQLGGVAADGYELKGAASDLAGQLGDGSITVKKAEQDAAGNVITTTYATKDEVSNLTTDDIDGGNETWIFYCGTASEVI